MPLMHTNELANVNGAVSEIEKACVPVHDHGFLYGDGVYETVRTYRSRPFYLPGHLDRLARSADAIRLNLPWSRGHIADEVDRTIRAALQADPGYVGEFAIRIMTTRGQGPLGYDPDLCPRPTLVILVTRLRQLSDQDRQAGVAAIISSVRRNPIEALDPRIKSSNLLNNILAAQQARDAGAGEAILFNTAGFLAEGTLTNVFFVKHGRVMTPGLDCGILSGITREIVLELLRSHGLPHEEGSYRREDLLAADEIFLTSTTREIIPVARLEGRVVHPGGRGPITERVQSLFRQRVEAIQEAESESESSRG
ncbi:MAG TPA: aminotransferase class IV [Patescibacteria group bacterium]|nr:aminotransferase class IV [Patescibacteria group bacterium]